LIQDLVLGFASRSLPRNYHSQSYLENKNILWVGEWNRRVLQPFRYNRNLYEMTINYNQNIDYGYEVNYLIYNYMVFFQNTYKQKLLVMFLQDNVTIFVIIINKNEGIKKALEN
jgi:hypothetical protein